MIDETEKLARKNKSHEYYVDFLMTKAFLLSLTGKSNDEEEILDDIKQHF